MGNLSAHFKNRKKISMYRADNSFDSMLLIAIGILVIVVWAGIVVATKLPRIEMLTRGVYEELKRIYDNLERGNRDHANSLLPCRSCGKPIEGYAKFCGACGQPVSQAVRA